MKCSQLGVKWESGDCSHHVHEIFSSSSSDAFLVFKLSLNLHIIDSVIVTVEEFPTDTAGLSCVVAQG